MNECPASPSFINGITGTVYNVYTCPEYRNRGIAKSVMEVLLGDALTAGISHIELSATNMGKKLYKNLGFCESSVYTHMTIDLKGKINEL